MDGDIVLSIEPVEAARWVEFLPGVMFLIEPISAEEDRQARLENTNGLGQLDRDAYGVNVLVTRGKLKDWKGIGDLKAKTAKPCSADNIRALIKHQGDRIVPFLTLECRSIDNYRLAEIAEAKKD